MRHQAPATMPYTGTPIEEFRADIADAVREHAAYVADVLLTLALGGSEEVRQVTFGLLDDVLSGQAPHE